MYNKILLISESYMPEVLFDTFRKRFFDVLVSVNHKFIVVKSNNYTDVEILEIVNKEQPELIISINRDGITRYVVENLPKCVDKVLTWFVDNYERQNEDKMFFIEKDYVFMFANGLFIENFVKKYGVSKEKVFFLPHFIDTNVYFDRKEIRDKGIIFLGTSYGSAYFIDIFSKIITDKNNTKIFLDVLDCHNSKYIFNLRDELIEKGLNFDTSFALEKLLNNRSLVIGFDDALSIHERYKYLSALADLDLHIYGVPQSSWIENMLLINPKLLKCFHYNELIDSPEELSREYNKSKIAFNVQHHQLFDFSVPTRILEGFASKSLILTPEKSKNTLSKMGYVSDKDYASFSTPEEAKIKAEYYLKHENERLNIVNSAYEKTKKSHTANIRISEMFKLINANKNSAEYLSAEGVAGIASKNVIIYVKDKKSKQTQFSYKDIFHIKSKLSKKIRFKLVIERQHYE